MVKGYPFVSFSLAHKASGLKSSSNTCNLYINTGRLYKSKYIFSSGPWGKCPGIRIILDH